MSMLFGEEQWSTPGSIDVKMYLGFTRNLRHLQKRIDAAAIGGASDADNRNDMLILRLAIPNSLAQRRQVNAIVFINRNINRAFYADAQQIGRLLEIDTHIIAALH